MRNFNLTLFILFCVSILHAQKNVGIGIQNPNSRLHIHQENVLSDPSSKIQLSNSTTGNGSSDGILLRSFLSEGSLMNGGNGNLHLGTNNINRLSILGNGKIGINTVNILGSSDFTIRSLSSSSYGGMYIESPDDSEGKPFYGYATDGYSTMWHYFDASSQSWRVYNNGERFSIGNNGKVGIGNLDPAQTLSVNGKIEVGNDNSPATPGTIRWSGNDFEGYNGTEYKSFTYYQDREDILGYTETYDLDFCNDPDTIIIYSPFPFHDVEDCGVLYDTGGPDSGYGNNQDIYYHVNGSFLGSVADYKKVIVESVDIEPIKDSLIIYCNDQAFAYSGLSTTPDTFLCEGGVLSVTFKSDASNPQPYAGFKIRFEFGYLDTIEQKQVAGYYFNPGNKSLAAGLNFDNEWENSLGANSLSFGLYSKALGPNAVALGKSAISTTEASIAIGQEPYSSDLYSIAIGKSARAYGESAVAIGNATKATSEGSTALGKYAEAECADCCAIGYNAYNNTDDAVVLGNSSVVSIGGYQNWSNLSDGRFKTDITENIPGLEFISGLRPITYKLDVGKLNDFKGLGYRDIESEEMSSNQIRTGFIAQEVESLANQVGYQFSGVFSPKDDNDHYSLRYAEFVVPLVKAVQELETENISLKAQLEGLDSELKALKDLVQTLESKI